MFLPKGIGEGDLQEEARTRRGNAAGGMGVPQCRMNGGETCTAAPGLPGYAWPCSSSQRRIHRRTVERSTFLNRSIGTELCSTFD